VHELAQDIRSAKESQAGFQGVQLRVRRGWAEKGGELAGKTGGGEIRTGGWANEGSPVIGVLLGGPVCSMDDCFGEKTRVGDRHRIGIDRVWRKGLRDFRIVRDRVSRR